MPPICAHQTNSGLKWSFAGFPNSTLLESGEVPIGEIAELAIREGQCTNPLYRVHRWFARRLGSQFRAILTGLSLEPQEADRFWDAYLGEVTLDGAIVLDPFVGGGTSLIEAGRCGASVIGYDIVQFSPDNLPQLVQRESLHGNLPLLYEAKQEMKEQC